jgi:hypothetical protein
MLRPAARALPRRRVRSAIIAGTTLTLVAAGIVASQLAQAADPCTGNAIVCENQNAGAPAAEWDDMWGAGDFEIQGFATDISVNAGQTVNFKISTPATSYTIDIYRIGYYGGSGARKITTINRTGPQNQTGCISNPATEIYDCGNWSVSASWNVPASAVSGIYLAKPSWSGGSSHIPFIVRSDASTSKMLFKTSDATWQAYNDFGGSNFYWGGAQGRALKASYNRPFSTRGVANGRDYIFSNEYPMIRFLERNGYDVTYTTDVDADRRGHLIQNHDIFLSVGHDEYWSGTQRTNVEAARDAGVNLAFFSGNEVYWKTRWESSVDGANTPYRTLVCYKETWAGAKIDPSPEWTGTWRDPRFTPPSNGGRPENGLTGTLYMSNNTDLAMQVPAAQGDNRFWRNTPVAAITSGTATLAAHTVGYESNEDLDNGFRPPGLIRLSTTTGPAPEYLRDFGSQTSPGTTTHHTTLYRAASGALVFSAGTIQWAWGLDSNHDGEGAAADESMQQATVNLFADMGVQPTTLMPTLDPVTQSADTVTPTAAFTSPANGTSVANGSQVTVQGTAGDTGGGRVAGVEVSTDNGATWHPATGTSPWSYTFFAGGVTTQVVKARAIDDSANIGTVAATLSLALTGPSTLFGQRVPAVPATGDTGSVTLGVKFTPQTDGNITGVRFYKGTGNTGTHTGSVWSSTGSLLRTGTFSGESGSGWQTLTFTSPLQVVSGTTYIASYHAPNGHYAADERYFSALPHNAFPLTAPRGQTSGGNGVYRTGNGFPVESSPVDTNYYVDVMFVDGGTSPPVVLATAPEASEIGIDLAARPSALFSKPLNPATIQFTLRDNNNVAVAGTVAYDNPSRTARFTPSANLAAGKTYTARVTATDTNGNPMTAAHSWTFTTTPYDSMSTLFAPDATPNITSSGESDAVTLGVKFTPTVSGKVVGVRYYQGPGNGGVHTGTLYSSGGSELAKATFSAGSGSGWQSVHFSTPVNVTAGTTYVAAYWAPNGNYAYTPGFFASAWTNSDSTLGAPAGANGVYRYGSDEFPTSNYNSTNYWVDPLFVPDGPPPPPPGPPNLPPGAATLFPSTATPAVASWDDGSSIELGVRFSSDVAGSVHGVRFYKGTQNTGVHSGTLWTADGTELASGTFVESPDGWQTMLFTTPIAITANTTYVVSYHTNVGYYALTLNGFSNAYERGPLNVPAGGAVYHYGPRAFPSSSSNHNYWVDVVFVAAN